MIAASLPTALIVAVIVAIPPTTSIFIHCQQKLTTPCTSLPPSKLTQLQVLCGTEHRAFVLPIDLNRPDAVSLKRRRPVIRRVAKKQSLSSGSRSAAPSKVTNYYSNRSVRGPWPTISMYLVRLVRTHIYDFLSSVWLLGKLPCHIDHIYDFGRNISGRQPIYMAFANAIPYIVT